MLIAEGDQDLWGLGETPAHAIAEHYSSVGLQCLFAENYGNIVHFGDEPNAEDSKLNDLYLKITSAELEPEDFANQAIASIALRRRELRYQHLAAVQARLWKKERASTFLWRGIFHTMALDGYFNQFGHSTKPPVKFWKTTNRTKSGYLLDRGGKLEDTDYEWNPWRYELRNRSEHPLPPYLIEPFAKPDAAAIANMKSYFRKRAREPIGPSPYITHLTQPFKEWKAGFSNVCKELESHIEKIETPRWASYDIQALFTGGFLTGRMYKGLLENTRTTPFFFSGNKHICNVLSTACARLNLHFCYMFDDFALFNRRISELAERFIYSAETIEQGVAAFNTASKHITGIPRPPDEANLTPVESLHYCLEMIEHELQRCS